MKKIKAKLNGKPKPLTTKKKGHVMEKVTSPKKSSKLDEKSASPMLDSLKAKLKESSYTVGDAIEEVGRKLQKSGYPKVGESVEKLGNKIEHLTD